MFVVSRIKHKKQPNDIRDLLAADRVEHKCATLDCALQVLRDLVTVADDEMASGRIFGYSVTVARSQAE